MGRERESTVSIIINTRVSTVLYTVKSMWEERERERERESTVSIIINTRVSTVLYTVKEQYYCYY